MTQCLLLAAARQVLCSLQERGGFFPLRGRAGFRPPAETGALLQAEKKFEKAPLPQEAEKGALPQAAKDSPSCRGARADG